MTAEEPVPRATLVSHHAGTLGSRYSLVADELVIGRAQDANVVLDSSSVSRHHARLTWADSTYVLEDLESTNGTWVNDRRLAGNAALNSGDVIRFGDLAFVYDLDAAAAMPAGPSHPGLNAGPGFHFFRTVHTLPHQHAAWLFFQERLRELSVYSAELAGRPNGGPVLGEVASALEQLAGNLGQEMESRD